MSRYPTELTRREHFSYLSLQSFHFLDTRVGPMHKTLKRILKPIYYSSALNPFRSAYCSAVFFNRYYRKRVFGIVGTTFRLPRELANFTYDLTPHNLNDLAHVVAIVSRKPVDEVRSYIDEARH